MRLYNLDQFPDLADATCGSMKGQKDCDIRFAIWPAITGSPKGTICLLQGRAEMIEKYFEVIGELRQRGFAVATLDWRGQGGSGRLHDDPCKGHIDNFSYYGKDLHYFLQNYVLPDCPPPYYALAHSTGGLILLNELPRLRTIFQRTLISAPLIELARRQRRTLGRVLKQSTIRNVTGFLKLIGFGKAYALGSEKSPLDPLGFYENLLTQDGPRYDQGQQLLEDYPQLTIAGPTNNWVYAACKAMDRLKSYDFQTTIHTPTLIVSASLDEIACPKAADHLARNLRSAHAVSITGSRHEIMMEKDIIRAQFWAAFDSFIPGEENF